ncbi:hypothetical protein [Spirillospora sp. NBC_01491]|uniref:hypothetical protein n=1 Tax=Spirillospora sp. NBC_01491 TaxID=2976007 RepID=UPI002E36DFAE|nr:hypothetical protein [Spirillospora sp. NBC_01491]
MIVLMVVMDVVALALFVWAFRSVRRHRGARADDSGQFAGMVLIGVGLVLLSLALGSAAP